MKFCNWLEVCCEILLFTQTVYQGKSMVSNVARGDAIYPPSKAVNWADT